MTIGDFIGKTKVTISNDLINYVIDGFLKSNLAFYKPNSSLMLYLETDKNMRGKVSVAQTNNFINRLMLDKLKDRYGAENYHLVDEAKRLKESRQEIDRINAIFKKNSFVNISKDGVIGGASLKYDHTFIINVRPEEYADVLNVVYENVRILNSDDIVICACSPNYASLGYTSPIKINCSVESLEAVMTMLDSMKHSFIKKTEKVLPIFNRMNTWYGYDQYDSYNQVEASAIFTMAIFNAIQKTFDVYLDQPVKINGELIKDYYESKPNKVQAMRDIINNSIILGDAFVSNIVLNTRNELASFGLTTTNILNVPVVEARMEDFYAYEPEELSVIETYELDQLNDINESISLEKEKTFESEQLSDEKIDEQEKLNEEKTVEPDVFAKEVVSEMVLSQDSLDSAKGSIEEEITPIVSSVVSEEETASKEKDVIEDDSHSIDPEETIVVEETSSSKDNYKVKSKKNDKNLTLEEIHNPDGLEILNPGSNCLEYLLKNDLLIPDLADIAYKGDSLKEALVSGGYQDDFEYIRDVAKHFHYDYTGSGEDDLIVLDILRNLSKYYFDGTPRDAVEEVIVQDNIVTQDETIDEQLSLEEIHNPDGLELLNPESNCLDYLLKNDLLIPDLSDNAYKGNSLEQALVSGGYQSDFNYIREVAEHFHYDYTGSEEDNLKMLDILRNLSKYYFDGTPREEINVAEVVKEELKIAEQSVEASKELVDDKKVETSEIVFRTKEEARDEKVISSLGGEIARAVQDVVNQMRQAASEVVEIQDVSEVADDQYQQFTQDFKKQEMIDETRQQYEELDKELEIPSEKIVLPDIKEEPLVSEVASSLADAVNSENPIKTGDIFAQEEEGKYLVNANYLKQFNDGFLNERSDKDSLSEEELNALRNSGLATLTDSINRLVDTIKVAEEKAQEDGLINDSTDERLQKYAYIVDDLNNLKQKVKNSDQTVLEYFEAEELEDNIQGNEILVFHDHSRKTVKQFVNEHLINYLVNFGSHDLSYILGLYADSIEPGEVIKK